MTIFGRDITSRSADDEADRIAHLIRDMSTFTQIRTVLNGITVDHNIIYLSQVRLKTPRLRDARSSVSWPRSQSALQSVGLVRGRSALCTELCPRRATIQGTAGDAHQVTTPTPGSAWPGGMREGAGRCLRLPGSRYRPHPGRRRVPA